MQPSTSGRPKSELARLTKTVLFENGREIVDYDNNMFDSTESVDHESQGLNIMSDEVEKREKENLKKPIFTCDLKNRKRKIAAEDSHDGGLTRKKHNRRENGSSRLSRQDDRGEKDHGHCRSPKGRKEIDLQQKSYSKKASIGRYVSRSPKTFHRKLSSRGRNNSYQKREKIYEYNSSRRQRPSATGRNHEDYSSSPRRERLSDTGRNHEDYSSSPRRERLSDTGRNQDAYSSSPPRRSFSQHYSFSREKQDFSPISSGSSCSPGRQSQSPSDRDQENCSRSSRKQSLSPTRRGRKQHRQSLYDRGCHPYRRSPSPICRDRLPHNLSLSATDRGYSQPRQSLSPPVSLGRERSLSAHRRSYQNRNQIDEDGNYSNANGLEERFQYSHEKEYFYEAQSDTGSLNARRRSPIHSPQTVFRAEDIPSNSKPYESTYPPETESRSRPLIDRHIQSQSLSSWSPGNIYNNVDLYERHRSGNEHAMDCSRSSDWTGTIDPSYDNNGKGPNIKRQLDYFPIDRCREGNSGSIPGNHGGPEEGNTNSCRHITSYLPIIDSNIYLNHKQLTVNPEVTVKEQMKSKDFKDDVLGEVVKKLVEDNFIGEDRGIAIDELYKYMELTIGIPFKSKNYFREVLENHQHVFQLIERDDCIYVSTKANLNICQNYLQKDSRGCDDDCPDLHVCMFYIFGSCAKPSCNFSHDLYEQHNNGILKNVFLHRVESEDIQDFMSSKNNRNETTMPKICSFYNKIKGCKRNGCSSLHVCQPFINGSCKFGIKCKRDHTFNTERCRRVLEKFALDNISLLTYKSLIQKRKMMSHRNDSSRSTNTRGSKKQDTGNNTRYNSIVEQMKEVEEKIKIKRERMSRTTEQNDKSNQDAEEMAHKQELMDKGNTGPEKVQVRLETDIRCPENENKPLGIKYENEENHDKKNSDKTVFFSDLHFNQNNANPFQEGTIKAESSESLQIQLCEIKQENNVDTAFLSTEPGFEEMDLKNELTSEEMMNASDNLTVAIENEEGTTIGKDTSTDNDTPTSSRLEEVSQMSHSRLYTVQSQFNDECDEGELIDFDEFTSTNDHVDQTEDVIILKEMPIEQHSSSDVQRQDLHAGKSKNHTIVLESDLKHITKSNMVAVGQDEEASGPLQLPETTKLDTSKTTVANGSVLNNEIRTRTQCMTDGNRQDVHIQPEKSEQIKSDTKYDYSEQNDTPHLDKGVNGSTTDNTKAICEQIQHAVLDQVGSPITRTKMNIRSSNLILNVHDRNKAFTLNKYQSSWHLTRPDGRTIAIPDRVIDNALQPALESLIDACNELVEDK